MHISIIGGSVGGLSSAIALKENDGYDVTIYETHEEIGHLLQCAEGYLATYELEVPPRNVIDCTIHSCIVRTWQNGVRKDRTISSEKERTWIIDRPKYEQLLANRCEKLGVDIQTARRATVRELKRKSEYVIDASGCYSQTSKEYGFRYEDVSRALQYTIEGDFSEYYEGKTIVMGYEPHYIGFYWIFPKSPKKANVGIGRVDSGDLHAELKRILEMENIEGDIINKTGGNIPCKPLKRFTYDNILLVGDAAGLANSFTGEGTNNAIISGRIAARCILKHSIDGYRDMVMAKIGGRLYVGRLMRNIMKNQYQMFCDGPEKLDISFEMLDSPYRLYRAMLTRPGLLIRTIMVSLRTI